MPEPDEHQSAERQSFLDLTRSITSLPLDQTAAVLETSAAIAGISLRAGIEFLRGWQNREKSQGKIRRKIESVPSLSLEGGTVESASQVVAIVPDLSVEGWLGDLERGKHRGQFVSKPFSQLVSPR